LPQWRYLPELVLHIPIRRHRLLMIPLLIHILAYFIAQAIFLLEISVSYESKVRSRKVLIVLDALLQLVQVQCFLELAVDKLEFEIQLFSPQ
jgi:hypothetical protein